MKKISASIIMLLLFVFITKVHAQPTAAAHKIVMQLTTADTVVYAGVFKQLKNLKEGWGDNVAIDIVCHGPGINLLLAERNNFSEKIKLFSKQGINFIACENTLKEKGISKEQIISEAQYVIMGIGAIVERQEHGWSYIKAGF